MLRIKKSFNATFNGRDYKGEEGLPAADLPAALESILVKDGIAEESNDNLESILVKDGIAEEANDKKEENDD